jgi:hypothetical protein
MNKRLIFEEVSRMHTLMGVKSNKVVSLLKEDISTGFARILGDFISASAKGASEIELASILKTLNDDERKFLDEFINDAKKVGKSGDISLNDLVAGIAKIDVYKALVKTIQSNQDIFFSTLGKKFNIKSLPSALSSKQQADLIMGKLYNSSNPQVRNIVQKLETGGTGLLPAERTLFVGELRKLNDDTANKIADELESGFKILDDVDAELKGGSKTVDAEYDELVFDEVSGEWVSKAEKEAGDASKGADDAGDDVPLESLDPEIEPEFIMKTSDELELEKAMALPEKELKLKYNEVVKFRKGNKLGELTSEQTAIVQAMLNKGLITEEEMIRLTTQLEPAQILDYVKFGKKITDAQRNPEYLTTQIDNLKKSFQTNPNDTLKKRIRLLQAIQANDFSEYMSALSDLSGQPLRVDVNGFSKKYGNKLGAILSYVNTPLPAALGGPGGKATVAFWKGFGKFTKYTFITGVGLTVLSFFTTLGDLAIETTFGGVGLNDALTKKYIREWSALAQPKIVLTSGLEQSVCPGANFCSVGGLSETEFFVFDGSLGLFVVKTPILEGYYFYKLIPYRLNAGLEGVERVAAGYDDRVRPISTDEMAKTNAIKGKEAAINQFIGKEVIIPTKTRIVTSTGTYTNDLKGFLAWCKAKGYTDCTNVGGKWEYKDKLGAYQQGKYVDTDNGWGN